jgi:hypothetical protein
MSGDYGTIVENYSIETAAETNSITFFKFWLLFNNLSENAWIKTKEYLFDESKKLKNNNSEKIQLLPLHGPRSSTKKFNMRRGGYNNLENARSATESSLFDLPNNMINYNERMTQLDDKDRESLQRLRRHLQFFFLDPMKKFKIRRQFPFKLALQIFKVVIVSLQLILFAQLRISHVDFLDETVTVMRHKFLRNWDDSRDQTSYPPETSRYAVFSSNQIIQHFSYIVTSYYNIGNESFASFSYDTTIPRPASLTKDDDHFSHIPPLGLCIERIADVSVENDTYVFDVSEVTDCFKLNFSHAEIDKIKEDPMNIRHFLFERNITFKAEDALIITKATINFNLRTIHFSAASTDQKPECYLIKIICIIQL